MLKMKCACCGEDMISDGETKLLVSYKCQSLHYVSDQIN